MQSNTFIISRNYGLVSGVRVIVKCEKIYSFYFREVPGIKSLGIRKGLFFKFNPFAVWKRTEFKSIGFYFEFGKTIIGSLEQK